MPLYFFSTDLHGHPDRYQKLYQEILIKKPEVLFLGGDLLPHGFGIGSEFDDFFNNFMLPLFLRLKKEMKDDYPAVFLILGNDDPRINEVDFIQAQSSGVWSYIHNKKQYHKGFTIYGYAYVPPTPFLLKDWERYDVSRYVDPGCIDPLEGKYSMPPPEGDIEYQTIQQDLMHLTEGVNLSRTIMLFHSPPYQTKLDRAALDGKMIEHVPLDVHVGSIAIKRFIEESKPMITLHGHIHEASRLTGQWNEFIGDTLAVNAAWDGPELSLVSFDPDKPESIARQLV